MRLLISIFLCVSAWGQILTPILAGGSTPVLPSGTVFYTDFSSADPAYSYTLTATGATVNYGNSGDTDASTSVNKHFPSASTFGASFGPAAFFNPGNGGLNFNATDITLAITYRFPTSTTSALSLIQAYSPSTFAGWGLMLNGDLSHAHKLCLWPGSVGWACSTSSVDDGSWHTSIITVSSTTVTFYLDGTADGSASSAHFSSWAGLDLIGNFWDGSAFVHDTAGLRTSGLAIWNRILNAGEIATTQSVLNHYPTRSRAIRPSRITLPPDLPTVPANNLTPTPPMGWNSWNYCLTTCTEAQIKAQADALVSTGLLGVGYNIATPSEIGMTRDGSGVLHANSTNFPSDVASLFSYLHGKGLKAGYYGNPGHTSCATSSVGSYRHQYQDALWLASVGADFLFYDQCAVLTDDYSDITSAFYTDTDTLHQIYAEMALALQASGRSIIFAADTYANSTYNLSWCAGVNGVGNTCFTRQTGDVHTWANAMSSLDSQVGFGFATSVGHWHDPDFVVADGVNLTDAQGKAQLSLWSILAAPLNISMDVTGLSTNTLATLKNLDVIAIDQDSLGYVGDRVSSTSCGGATCEVWAKQLSGSNRCAVVLLNRDSAAHNITLTVSALTSAISGCTGPWTSSKDIWSTWPTCTSNHCAASLGTTISTTYTATSVPATSAVMLQLIP